MVFYIDSKIACILYTEAAADDNALCSSSFCTV